MKNEIKKIIRESLNKEAIALSFLAKNPPENLSKLVDDIYNCNGKIVFIGIGKSAIVGKKISASLNSIGTSAFFIHAADALHGDIGAVNKEDLIVAISKSGQSEESIAAIKLLYKDDNKVVSIVNNIRSKMVDISDYVIFIDHQDEADPLNLLPTTSTILQMAVGDAIVSAMVTLKKVDKSKFKKLHPGGNLGLQMDVLVRDINNQKAKPWVFEDANIKDVIIEISSSKLGATVVLSNSKEVIGIVTDGDLRRMLLGSKYDLNKTTAKDIMSKNPKTILPNELAQKALKVMKLNKITQLIICDHGTYCGIVHMHELLQFGLY